MHHALHSQSGDASWVTPLVGLLGVLAGAAIAGAVQWVGAKTERRTIAQRQALYEVQNGSLALRNALIQYGKELPRPRPATVTKVDNADGSLDALIQRVDSYSIRVNVDDWRQIAQRFWLG